MNDSSVNATSVPQGEEPTSSGASSQQKQPVPDITIDEVIAAVSDLITAKKLQFSAQWDLVAAEAKLLRQSILVTALATLAALGFACVCWLIINATTAVLLSKAGLHAAIIAAILLLLNGILMFIAWRVAQDAFKHISVNPLIAAVKGKPETYGVKTPESSKGADSKS